MDCWGGMSHKMPHHWPPDLFRRSFLLTPLIHPLKLCPHKHTHIPTLAVPVSNRLCTNLCVGYRSENQSGMLKSAVGCFPQARSGGQRTPPSPAELGWPALRPQLSRGMLRSRPAPSQPDPLLGCCLSEYVFRSLRSGRVMIKHSSLKESKLHFGQTKIPKKQAQGSADKHSVFRLWFLRMSCTLFDSHLSPNYPLTQKIVLCASLGIKWRHRSIGFKECRILGQILRISAFSFCRSFYVPLSARGGFDGEHFFHSCALARLAVTRRRTWQAVASC